MTLFGDRLRTLRQACKDPITGWQLSQMRFGELLQDEYGKYFSGAAVSDWERGESEIRKNDRKLLIAVLRVLHKTGGLKSVSQAADLLRAGNYRALDKNEKKQVFPEDLLKASTRNIVVGETREQAAPPAWSLITAALMRKTGDLVEASNPLRALTWLVVWILAFFLLIPAWQWPFAGREAAFDAVLVYIYASFALPLCIGLSTNTGSNPVWKGRIKASAILRLYTYQGAFIGFHVGYFAVFAIHLVAYYFQLRPPMWSQFVLTGFTLFMGAAGAHLIPDNLWRAYERLSLRDGWVFFIFIPVGPFLGWFFLEFYALLLNPALGAAIIIAALILTAWLTGSKQARRSA